MALSANRGSTTDEKFGTIFTYTVGEKIWRGAVVVLRLATGLAHPAVEDPSDTHKQLVVGWAYEEAEIGATVRIRNGARYKLKFEGEPIVGQMACVKDDETVQPYGALTGHVAVGRITEVSGTDVYIDFDSKLSRLVTSIYD